MTIGSSTVQQPAGSVLGDDGSLAKRALGAAHAAMGFIATSPAPTYSATGNLLTATIDGAEYIATYDANDNIQTTSYRGVTKTYSWAIQADGQYHCVGIV